MELTRTFKQIKAYADQRGLPVIPVNARNVSIVRDPSTFYKLLLNGIKNARNRVALSALYVGIGSKEQVIMKALQENLTKNPKLEVSMTLDMNRSKRENSLGQSSVSMIQEFLGQKFAGLNLMRSNLGQSSGLQKLFSRFQRLNELSSTYHAKSFVSDNNVIITGANLSNIYFEERQDRYIKIKDSKILSDYITGFLYKLREPIAQSLTDLIDGYNRRFITNNLDTEALSDCYIIPMSQFGHQDVHTCDEFLLFLDSILPAKAEVHLSTGYFNPKISIKLDSVIAPSEQANGFFGGSGLLKYVPRLYTVLMNLYLKFNPNCSLYLYKRPMWSYHAKGLWVEGLQDLGIYMIGSSNYNWRSSQRDFEMQYLILTTNADLKQSFQQERYHLLAASSLYEPSKSLFMNPIYFIAAKLLKSLL